VEESKPKPYKELVFIEFLEFICRIGIFSYKSNYVKTYGLDRIDIKISKAEPVLQLIEIVLDFMQDDEKRKVLEITRRLKEENKFVRGQSVMETHFDGRAVVPILVYESDAGSCYQSEGGLSE
jgi:hypothetical protein